ncbi:hypothetical protein M427DRAFT_133604 [Gonapodya prolifera JEL478]|uniref:TLC domain-containing protein n=1 Tax=Gonapodya prolifera (strain JEL478) TaxID=1344416 RepID=A0A139AK55_GONPJ|nr:hypothetical protein M427DRAFT_133604 [Gonapodya prolifera JEL478]|eukprot:KXS17146.1 hypothetical protein M427DRAFT_133604 [Gonapodya prolifera JEL478]
MVQAILGYQMYDLVTMWLSGSHWTLWIHHGVVATHALLYLSSHRALSFLGLVWSPCELTAIAHNSVWYYQTVLKYAYTGSGSGAGTMGLPSSTSPKDFTQV